MFPHLRARTFATAGRPKLQPPKKGLQPPKKGLQPPKKVRIPKELQPPKRAPGPYCLFYADFLKAQPKMATIQEYQQISKRAGEVWRGYSVAEKQPFYDENEARKIQANQAREEFFNKTSSSELRQLNAIRKAQNKPKYHSGKKHSRPMPPFILFSQEFRQTPEAEAIINGMSPEKNHAVRAVIAAADRWKSMSEAEKAPYRERYKKEKEELEAAHAET